jgi:hypothetical protein
LSATPAVDCIVCGPLLTSRDLETRARIVTSTTMHPIKAAGECIERECKDRPGRFAEPTFFLPRRLTASGGRKSTITALIEGRLHATPLPKPREGCQLILVERAQMYRKRAAHIACDPPPWHATPSPRNGCRVAAVCGNEKTEPHLGC